MYSEPLVKGTGNKLVSLSMGEPVNYEVEINRIKEILADIELQVSMFVENATLANLERMLYNQPIILHLICHGDIDLAEKKFYLAFEKKNGYLEKLYTDTL